MDYKATRRAVVPQQVGLAFVLAFPKIKKKKTIGSKFQPNDLFKMAMQLQFLLLFLHFTLHPLKLASYLLRKVAKYVSYAYT